MDATEVSSPRYVIAGFKTKPVASAQHHGQSCSRKSPTGRSLLSELLLRHEGICRYEEAGMGHDEDEDGEMSGDELSEQEHPSSPMDEDEACQRQSSGARRAAQQRRSPVLAIPATRRSNMDAIARAIHAQQVQQLLIAHAQYTERVSNSSQRAPQAVS